MSNNKTIRKAFEQLAAWEEAQIEPKLKDVSADVDEKWSEDLLRKCLAIIDEQNTDKAKKS